MANKCSQESIKKFISLNDINSKKLFKKIIDSQNDKHYILYYKNKFYYDNIKCKNIKIIKTIKTKNSYKIFTNFLNVNVLLRWKNCNGIAFPAFQISKFNQ